MGELPEGDEEAVVVSTLPVLRVSCNSRVEVLLLCGVTVARENAKGGEPMDDMLPPSGRVMKHEWVAAGNRLAKAQKRVGCTARE